MTTKEAMIKKLGSYEAYIEWLKENSRRGGSAVTERTRLKGFGSNQALAAEMGRRGGNGRA